MTRLRKAASSLLVLAAILSTGPAYADFDVEILAGAGSTNITAGPAHSATGTPASIGVDELITTLTTSGSVELNTGVGGAEPGNITSLGISISGTTGLLAPGGLTLDAANNIDLGLGGILFDSTTAFAPDIDLTAGGSINLGAIESTGGTAGGAIHLDAPGNITTTSIDTRSVTGNGGALTVTDTSGSLAGVYNLGQVNTGSDGLTTNQNSSDGGDIVIGRGSNSLPSFEDLFFTTLNSSSRGDALAGDGGNIEALGDDIRFLQGTSVVTSSSANGSAGSGGGVLIEGAHNRTEVSVGTIDTRSVSLGGAGVVGDGGEVSLDRSNGIIVGTVDTSVISPNGSGGSAGAVILDAGGTSGISVGNIRAKSEVATANGTANGGNVSIDDASDGIFITGEVNTTATAGNGGSILIESHGNVVLNNSTLNSSSNLNGGNISVTSETDEVSSSGTIGSGRTVGAGLALGNSGNISINGDSLDLNTVSTSQTAGLNVGTSGTIMLTSDATGIVAGLVDTSISSGGMNDGSGATTIDSAAGISLTDINTSNTGVGGTPNGGAVNLTAIDSISLTGDINTSATEGVGGVVNLTSNNSISLGAIESTGGTAGGAIHLDAPGNITTTSIDTRSVTGNGGALTVTDTSGSLAGVYNLGQVNTGSDGLTTNQNSSDGGDIVIGRGSNSLPSFEDLFFTTLNSSSRGDALAGDGGNIEALGDDIRFLQGTSVVTSSSANGSAGSGGGVLIEGAHNRTEVSVGTIDTRSVSLGGAGVVGDGGEVSLDRSNGIIVGTVDTSVISPNGSGGSAGAVILDAGGTSGISVGNIRAKSEVATANGTANGGNVSIDDASDGIFITGEVNTTATAGNGGSILIESHGNVVLNNSTLNSSSNLNGGNISVTSETDELFFGGTITSVGGFSSGNITLAARTLTLSGTADSIDRGTAQATLKTGSNSTAIIVGSSPTPSVSDLVLDDNIFDKFTASTGLMNIGQSGRSVTITVESDLLKKSPVAFRQPTVVTGALTNSLGLEFHKTATIPTNVASDGPLTFFDQGTVDGIISGTGQVIKSGTGSLALNSANTHSGDTTINGGNVVLGNVNALQDSTVNIDVNDGLDITTNTLDASLGGLAGTGNLNLGAQQITVGSNHDNTTYAGVLSGTGNLTKQGNGTLGLAGANTHSGGTLLEGGTLSLANDSAAGTGTITVIPNLAESFSSVAGSFTLNGDAAIDSGSLRLTDAVNNQLGSGVSPLVSPLPVDSFSASFNFQIGPGTGTGADGLSFALMDAGVYDATAVFGENGPGANSLTVSFDTFDNGGSEPGGNFVEVLLNGSSIATAIPSFTLEDSQFHRADLTFDGSTLSLSVTPSGFSSPEFLFDGLAVPGYTSATSRIGFGARTGGETNEHRIGNLSFSIPSALPVIDYTAGTTIANPIDLQRHAELHVTTGFATQSGTIGETAGPFGVVKTGAGSLSLTESSTYTGDTIIDAGTLLANNTTGLATGPGFVIVNDGGTLGGDGAVNFVTVNSGGTIAPGDSAGILSVGNSVFFENGSMLEMEIGGLTAGTDFDLLFVDGDVVINSGSTLAVSLISDFVPAMGDQFLIMTATDSLNDEFSNVGDGARLDIASGAGSFLVDYDSVNRTLILSDFLATIAGDFDLDLDVDGFDFLKWQRGESPNGAYSTSDLSDWETNYGMVAPLVAAASTVPEPNTLLLVALASLLGISVRRRA